MVWSREVRASDVRFKRTTHSAGTRAERGRSDRSHCDNRARDEGAQDQAVRGGGELASFSSACVLRVF